MATGATIAAAAPKEPNPKLSACGMGPMMSTFSGETKVRIELVPVMYSNAIIGVAIRVARAMLRAGLRDSPAKMVTVSKPERAPNVILAKTLRLNRVRGGSTSRAGWYSARLPRQSSANGSAASTAMIKTVNTLPALLIHLPMRSPNRATNIMPAMDTKDMAIRIFGLEAIHSALGPAA
jgi:hypothetical protein